MSGERSAVVADLAVERDKQRHLAAQAQDATHHDMARAWLASQAIGDYAPVYTAGQFYVPARDAMWHRKSFEQAQVEIAGAFNGRKLCKRASDYRQIADHASAIAERVDFFDSAPVGVTTPSGFYRLADGRRCERVELSLEHRQSFRLAWDPDFDAEPVRVNAMLEHAFEGDSAEEQLDMFWQAMGSILFGLLVEQQLVVLLLGREKSGKSTSQRIIERAFPPEAVSAVSPSSWGREYNVAAMANKRLNLVGELADDAPIPAAPFKNVTGGNLIEARHPNHRPFYYVSRAAHLFASNVLPPTTDRTEAFFRRWRVIRFANRVADDQADPHLVERIVSEEMPAFLAYAFRGAERAAERGSVRTSPAHDAVISRWKAAANPVLQFLLDDQWIRIDPTARSVSTRAAYAAYRRWAAEVGMRNPFGRNHFLELIDSTGASIGVGRRKLETTEVVAGIELLTQEGLT